MSGAGDDRLYVSSWGWETIDEVLYRRWSVSVDSKRVSFLLVLPEFDTTDVLVMAYKLYGEDL